MSFSFASPEVSPTAAEREAERAFWRRLGVDLPDILLDDPFASPWTSRSFIVPTSWYRSREGSERVSARALRADLDLLEVAFEEAYGGMGATGRDFEFGPWFASWKRMAERLGDEDVELAQAFSPMRVLQEHRIDNHTGPLLSSCRFGGCSRTYRLAEPPRGECLAIGFEKGIRGIKDDEHFLMPRQVAGPEAEPLWVLTLPSVWGNAQRLECERGAVSLRDLGFDREATQRSIEELSREKWNRPAVRELASGQIYVRLPTFTAECAERILELARAEQPRASTLLVVDLRLNDGGMGGVAPDLLSRWLPMDDLLQKVGTNRRSRVSPLTQAFGWGFLQVMMAQTPGPLSEEMKGHVLGRARALLEPCESGWETESSPWSFGQHAYVPAPNALKVVVLMDRGTASDGEWLAENLAAYPHTLLMGENSAGVGEFTQPLYFVLPHTRVPFRVARGRSDTYGDGRPFDGFGLTPDVVVPGDRPITRETLLSLGELPWLNSDRR